MIDTVLPNRGNILNYPIRVELFQDNKANTS